MNASLYKRALRGNPQIPASFDIFLISSTYASTGGFYFMYYWSFVISTTSSRQTKTLKKLPTEVVTSKLKRFDHANSEILFYFPITVNHCATSIREPFIKCQDVHWKCWLKFSQTNVKSWVAQGNLTPRLSQIQTWQSLVIRLLSSSFFN